MNIPQGNTKEELKQREEIISQVYRRWTAENPDKRVYNRSLKDYINIRYLSITETMRHAAKTYASTLAMLQLDTILRYSVKFGKPKPPKKQKKPVRSSTLRKNRKLLTARPQPRPIPLLPAV